MRPFDLGRRKADPVPFAQKLIRCTGLPVNANQVVIRLAGTDLLLEELLDCRAILHVDVIGEAAAVVVDK